MLVKAHRPDDMAAAALTAGTAVGAIDNPSDAAAPASTTAVAAAVLPGAAATPAENSLAAALQSAGGPGESDRS